MQVVLRPLAAALVALVACTGDFPDKDGVSGDADTDTDADTDADSDADSDSDVDDLPDLSSGHDETGCEDWEGHEIPGAASYYYGWMAVDGDGWSGEESWLLYANDTWVDEEGSDCAVVWTTVATEGDRGFCGTCDLGLDIAATLDATRTTCPEDLYKGEEVWSTSYALRYESDSEVTVFYSSNGDELAAGYYSDAAFNYVTTKACKWF